MHNIVFRADANVEIGTGHLMRCLTLADKLQFNNLNSLFIISKKSVGFINFIKKRGYTVHVIECSHNHSDTVLYFKKTRIKPSWLVIDHYNINIEWETAVKPYVSNILVIDDLANRSHDCDAILNPNLHSDFTIYDGLISQNCKKFIGPRFSLLGNQYQQFQNLNKNISDDIFHIAIFMGGGDFFNITEHLIDHFFSYFEYLKGREIHIDVIIGSQHPNKKSIEDKCKKIPYISLYVDTPNMAQILSKVDLCVGAGGGAALERCCLGIPSIVLTFADNQIRGVEALVNSGAVLFGGDYRQRDWKNLFKEAVLKIQSSTVRQSLSSKALSIVDGKGSDRVAAYMELKTFNPVFKNVDIEDAKILFDWRNNEDVRRYSGNPQVLVFNEHMKWLEESLDNPDQILLMLWVGNVRFGHIRYSVKDNIALVSIVVNPVCQNLGIGSFMLEKSIPFLTKFNNNIIYIDAKIHRDNISSLAVFKKAGYTHAGVNDVWVSKQKRL